MHSPIRQWIHGQPGIGRTIAEAMWLAALMIAPLLFAPANPRPFEFYNTVVFRILAISSGCVLAMVYLSRPRRETADGNAPGSGSRIEARRGLLLSLRSIDPIVLASVGLLAIQSLGAALSSTPSISLFGTSQRNQGLLTSAAYLVLFWCVASNLCGEGQRRRAIFIISMAGLVAAIYAIQQRLGLDPVALSPNWESSRVASSLGNPVFLGAFLILIIPLLVGRLIEHGLSGEGQRGRGLIVTLVQAAGLVLLTLSWLGGSAWLAGLIVGAESAEQGNVRFYTACATMVACLALAWFAARHTRRSWILSSAVDIVLLSALLAALILTKSRGPVLGLAAALVTLYLLYAATKRRRGLAVALVLVLVLGAVSIGGIRMFDPPGTSAICRNPTVGRILCPLADRPEAAETRPLIWRGSLDLILANSQLGSQDSVLDRWSALRPVIGYGQETMLSAFPRFAPAELNAVQPVGVAVDRAHNGVLDVLIQTGLIGLLAAAGLTVAVLGRSLAWLGLVPGRQQWLVLVGLVGMGAALGCLFMTLALDWIYWPVGLVVGSLVGLWSYLLWTALRPGPGLLASVDIRVALPAIAVLAALAGHVVEQQVSFETTTTQVYGWFMLGALVALFRRNPSSGASADRSVADRPNHSPQSAGAIEGVLTGLLLSLPVFAYLQAAAGASSEVVGASPVELVRSAFFQQPSMSFEPAVLVGTCLVAVVGVALNRARREVTFGRSEGAAGVLTFVAWGAGTFSLAVLLMVVQVLATRATQSIELQLLSAGRVLLAVILIGLLVVLFPPAFRLGLPRAITAAGLALIAVVAGSRNLDVLRADALNRQAMAAVDVDRRLAIAEQAAATQPERFAAESFLGQVYAAAALETSDPARRQALAQMAQSAWEQAQVQNPYDFGVQASMADLHRGLAPSSTEPEDRLQHLAAAIEHRRTAIALNPSGAYLHAMLGLDYWLLAETRDELGLADAGDRSAARAAVDHAVALDPGSCFIVANRALVDETWQGSVRLALSALHRSECRAGADLLTAETQETALRALIQGSDTAETSGQAELLREEVRKLVDPGQTLAVVMAMARRYLEEDRLHEAGALLQLARQVWPEEVEAQYGELLRRVSAGKPQ